MVATDPALRARHDIGTDPHCDWCARYAALAAEAAPLDVERAQMEAKQGAAGIRKAHEFTVDTAEAAPPDGDPHTMHPERIAGCVVCDLRAALAAAEAAPHAEVDAAAWHAAVCESPTGKAEAAPLDVRDAAAALVKAYYGDRAFTREMGALRDVLVITATSREGDDYVRRAAAYLDEPTSRRTNGVCQAAPTGTQAFCVTHNSEWGFAYQTCRAAGGS